MSPSEIAYKRAKIYEELAKHPDKDIRESVKAELLTKAARKIVE
jgi:hypothetical protein